MAGGRKKKSKPAANPSRGFATNSLPSKARVETEAPPYTPIPTSKKQKTREPLSSLDTSTAGATSKPDPIQSLSAEEYEKHLEQSELQILVEKHGPKVKREAQRQKSRLETDLRVSRSQAEPLNTKKWLPPEVLDAILDLIQAEGRYSNTSLTADNLSTSKLPPQEDLIVKLWTLQETLVTLKLPVEKMWGAVKHVLDIATNVPPPNSREPSIWGLEEALDWFARECGPEDLPDYDSMGKHMLGMLKATSCNYY